MSAEEALRDALRRDGIEYDGPICIDGKLHRFKADGDNARNSWYVVHDGSPAVGVFGCWKRGIKTNWCERNGNLSPTESQQIRKRWEQAHATLKTETLARQKKARDVAAWILNRSRPARSLHRYLSRKRVKVFGDVREYRRLLVLPLRDARGELHSLQFIEGDGTKNFLTGGRVAGCSFVLADNTERPLVICEGYATGASVHQATSHAVICAMNSGNLVEVAKATRERWPEREIIIAGDDDQFTDGNPGLTKATAAAKAIGARLAVPQFDDLANKPADFNDLATAQGLDFVKQQIDCAAKSSADTPSNADAEDQELMRLAEMTLQEYEKIRKDAAKKLNFRPGILDALVKMRRPSSATNNLQGVAVHLEDVEPWPESVDGAEVLNAIAKIFEHYVVLPEGAADTLALWCAHTHPFKIFQKSPRLNISAPTEECGKSTLLNCVSLFCARAKRTDNMTTAVMFRLVAGHSATILADECDKWLFINGELVGLVQSGAEKGGTVMRCEGDSNDLREFGCYAPFALAAIGKLPSQLHSRSIPIRLERAKREEMKARACFNFDDAEYETELNRKLARWTADNRERIGSIDPKLPEHLFNRIGDLWRPLFQIAEVPGGDWPDRCRAALRKLTTGEDERENLRVMLLADIRQLFVSDQMFSKDLVEQLAELKDRPWPDINYGKPISQRWLAINLGAFGIQSHNIRIGEDQAKGYERAQFDKVFDRYISENAGAPPQTSVQASHTRENAEKTSVPEKNVGTLVKTPIHEASGRMGHFSRGVPPKKGKI